MKTKHTSGKWHYRTGDSVNFCEIIGDYETNKCIAVAPKYCFVEKDEAEANGRLIAAAPDMLKELILTYLRLQIESLKDKSMKFAVTTDYMRASLRNKIAKILDVEDIELQSQIESIANDFVNNRIGFNEAIKKAIE